MRRVYLVLLLTLGAYCSSNAQELGIRLGNVSEGNVAIDAPIDPNRKPVIIWRIFTFGIRSAIGLPEPVMKMTSDKPASSNRAVPGNSE